MFQKRNIHRGNPYPHPRTRGLTHAPPLALALALAHVKNSPESHAAQWSHELAGDATPASREDRKDPTVMRELHGILESAALSI